MVAAAVAVGAAVVGAGATIYSSNRATRAQTDAANQANQVSQAQYDQTRADLAPWRGAGNQALNALTYGLGFSGATNPYAAGANVAGNHPVSSVSNYYHGGNSYGLGNPQPPGTFNGDPRAVTEGTGPRVDPMAGGGWRGAGGATLAGGLTDPNAMPVYGQQADGTYGLVPNGSPTPAPKLQPDAAIYSDYADYADAHPGASLQQWQAFQGSPANHPTASNYGLGAQAQAPATTEGLGDFNRDFALSDFQQDPGYQFRLDQGNRALGAGATARGLNLSGATLKALDKYNQGQASQEFQSAYDRWNSDRNNRFNRLASIAGLGQTANNTGIAAGQSYAGNVSSNYAALGNAQAANAIATGNAVNSSISNGISQYQNYQLLNSLKTKTG